MREINRPEGFENEKQDCAVRALSLAGNIPYEKSHDAFEQLGRKFGHGIKSNEVLQKVCKILKLEARQIKRSGSVNKLIRKYPHGNIYCRKRNHAFAVINGVAHDLESNNSHVKGAWIITSK